MVKSTQIFCILLVLVLPTALSKVYNTKISCGVCTKTTGCPGNKCILVSGDIDSEYCDQKAECTIQGNKTFSLGLCKNDLSGFYCPSGVCAMGDSVSLCYKPTDNVCRNGGSFKQSCIDGTKSMTFSQGKQISIHSFINWDFTCQMTSASGTISTCSKDALGSTCDCCSQAVIQGMKTILGTCIPQDSPLVKTKISMQVGETNTPKFGLHYLFSLAVILLQVILIVF